MNPKLETFEKLLAEGPVNIVYNPQVAGVVVPPVARSSAPWRAALNFSNNFRGGPPAVGEDGVMATLSFNKQPFECYVPWTAVYILQPADLESGGLRAESEIHIFGDSAPAEWVASLPLAARATFEQMRRDFAGGAAVRIDAETTEAAPQAPLPPDLPSNVVPFRRKT